MADTLKIPVLIEITLEDFEKCIAKDYRHYVKLKSREEPYEADEDTYEKVLAWITEMNAKRERPKRCPFCGSPVTVTTTQIEHPDWWAAAAECDDIYDNGCSCQMVAGGDTEQQAVKNLLLCWNRRAWCD